MDIVLRENNTAELHDPSLPTTFLTPYKSRLAAYK